VLDQQYDLIIPGRMNMTWWALDRWASRDDGDRRPAIYHEDDIVSYRGLQKSVNKFGNLLKKRGVAPGDKVLLRMPNHPSYIALAMATIKIGAVIVPTSTLFRAREVEYILNDSEAKVAISMPDLLSPLEESKPKAPKLQRILVAEGEVAGYDSVVKAAANESDELENYDTSKDDLAFILYTSGTTAFPKGVPHTHKWLMALGDPNSNFVMGTRGEDRILTPIEMTWMWPWGYCIWFTMYKGAATCIYNGRFDAERTLQYMEKYRATQFLGNPTIYRNLLRVENAEKVYDLASLRAAFSSGETLAPEIFREWKTRFDTEIFDCMGQTEMHVFCATRPGATKLGSMGKAMPSIPVAVIRQDGSMCSEKEVGYLAVRRSFPGLTKGYLNREDDWAKTMTGDWYLTWDYAYVDEDGFFWYVSRTDDLIKSRGYLIAPKEIEDVLQEHRAVMESAVVGLPDTEMRERVKAFIVLRDGYAPSRDLAADIRQFVAGKIAPFKAPKEIEFTQTIPKTVTSKIMRRVLKQEGEDASKRRTGEPSVYTF